jgi:hypothetical protein
MIVKNLLVVGVVAGFATAAAAAEESKGSFKVGAKIRLDNVQSATDTKDDGADKVTTKASGINLHTAQFTLTGESGSDSLYMKYYANENYLRTATITHKFTDMVSATFGKMQLLAGSWENDYSSSDQYVYSMSHDAMGWDRDANGAIVSLSFGDHKLALQATEGETMIGEGDAATMFEQNGGLTTALQYRGSIGPVRPLISHSMVRTAASRSTDGGTNYGDGYLTITGLGVQADAVGATVDLELDTVKVHKQKGAQGAKDMNVQSIIAQVKYPVGSTTPFLKLASDSFKMGAEKDVGDETSTKIVFGAEHKLDSSCRLHALYMMDNGTTKNAEGKDDKVTMTGFNIGVTASM